MVYPYISVEPAAKAALFLDFQAEEIYTIIVKYIGRF